MITWGFLLPEAVLSSTWFAVLTAFVSINTVMYVTLAALKTLPVIRPRDWFPRGYVRAHDRSIYPAPLGHRPPGRVAHLRVEEDPLVAEEQPAPRRAHVGSH